MPIRPQSVHMAHGTWLHCLSSNYTSADDQQQGDTRLWAMQNCIARRDLALRSCRVSQPICWSIAVTLLVRPKLLQVYLAYRRCIISSLYVFFRVWVPDRASVLQNWPNESLVGPFLDRCWCSAEIPLEEGTSVVGLLGCLVDVLRPCTVLVESHSKVLCCISHLQHMYARGCCT